MLIRKIKLVNFRGIKKETLYPPLNKSFVLLGKNGSGKSTFIYAPAFCFYGYAPWKLENTLKWGTKKGYVEIDFEIGENKYRARRELDKRSSSFMLEQYIEENKEFKDIGGGLNKQAEETFKKIFPVPKEAFLQVVTKTQGELGDFCNATSKGMYDIIKEFVEVVKFEKYKKKNDDILENLRNERIELTSTITSSKNAIENLGLRDITQKEINDTEKEIKILKEKVKGIKRKLEYSKEWHKQDEKYGKAKEIINKLKGIEKWHKKWQPLKTIEKPEEIYDENKLEKLNNQLEFFRNKKEEIPNEISVLEDNIEGMEENLEELKKELNEFEKKNSKIFDKMEDEKRQKELLKEGKCPTCKRRFRKTEDRIKEKEQHIDELNDELISDEIINQKEKEINKVKSKINDFKTEKKKLDKEMMNVITKIGDIENKITKMQTKKEETEKWKKKQQFIENYPFEIDPDKGYRKLENAKEVETPEGDEPKHVQKLENEYDKLTDEYYNKKSKYKELKKSKEQFDYHKKEIEDAKEDLEEVENQLDKHEKLDKVYSRHGAPHFMVKEFLQHLQHNANKYLDRFTQGRISIKFKTNHNSKRKPIDLIFYDARRNNKPRPFSTFSGGEKTRVALSIEFLGLGKTFSELTNINLQTGLIDEVYGLDEEGQEEFAQILNEMSGARAVIGGVACFEDAGYNFENMIKVENGKLIK